MTEVKSQESFVNVLNLEVLEDKSITGKDNDWRLKKLFNRYLSSVYENINKSKAARLLSCSEMLTFIYPCGKQKLKRASFCRVRLCPVCQWRRSLKTFGQVSKIMQAMAEKEPYKYLLMSLTVKNVSLDQLSQTIADMMKSWQRFSQLSDFRNSFHGFYRAMEITRNSDEKSEFYGTFHPHFHIIFAVSPSYFSGDYIARARWQDLWQKSARLDYSPLVDVRRIKGNTVKAVAEVAKYTVKSSDFIIPDDYDLSVELVRGLDNALDKRRFVAFGGCFKYYHKLLNLDDVDDGDLVNTDNLDDDCDSEEEISYVWLSGFNFNNYYKA